MEKVMNKIKLKDFDKEIYQAIKKENKRQEEHIELIASENYASKAVMEAQGSQLTNKYAEGYPNKRYYGGCEYVDIVENLAIERAKQLFNCDYVNVQPHSGSQANASVYSALLNVNDVILGMDLAHGGHLTHGAKVSFSGKNYLSCSYGINAEGLIDYNEVEKIAVKHKPKLIIAGFSAYSQIVNWKRMREIADKVNAYLLVDMAHVAGLVATGLYPSPLPYAHVVTTTTHKTLAGPRGGMILSSSLAFSKNDEKNKDINSFEELTKKLNNAVFPTNQGGPLMHVMAAKAVCFKEALTKEFTQYQKQVIENAKIMVEIFKENGFKVVSNGTENHLFLLDLSDKNITGKEASDLLEKYNITVNKNSVPNDKQKPTITSGIRIGTPAITRRGFREKEVKELTLIIIDILLNHNKNINKELKNKIKALCNKHKVY